MHHVEKIAVLASLLALAGCWTQHDVVSIKVDGMTSFETSVVITKEGFSQRDIDQLTFEFMKELRSAGWQVERKWLSRSEPFKLSFSGRGDIRLVRSAPSFYRIAKVSENTYSIRFIPAEAKGGKSSRSIRFERGILNGAKVIDDRGNKVKEIQNVMGDQTYRIVF